VWFYQDLQSVNSKAPKLTSHCSLTSTVYQQQQQQKWVNNLAWQTPRDTQCQGWTDLGHASKVTSTWTLWQTDIKWGVPNYTLLFADIWAN